MVLQQPSCQVIAAIKILLNKLEDVGADNIGSPRDIPEDTCNGESLEAGWGDIETIEVDPSESEDMCRLMDLC